MIEGVEFKELTTHADDRGFFREIIRNTDEIFKAGFGQISHSLVFPGIIKAWHGHKLQTQWNYVTTGLIKVVLYDNRESSKTYKQMMEFLSGDHQTPEVYCFPPGVLHGYKCINGPMNIIYITSGIYDLKEEVRIPNDNSIVEHIWL
jgi:dTDP-4-dehydrorhamnose 3,5-epimerase